VVVFRRVLDDGSTLVINFMVKDIRGGRGIKQPASPVVTFQLDRPDGTHVERALHARDDFAFAADRCDVRVGGNTFAGDLRTYRIHTNIDGVTADVILTGQVPSWRPETGHILFGDDQPHVFAWARAEAGGYCVIASDITAERKYGHTQVPIFMLARDGKIVADDSSLVRFEKTGENPDPVTGKPVADTTVYDYDATADGGEHYRVTFRRQNTIVQARMIDSVQGPKRILARIAGFDGAYMRFTGQVTVERIGSDPVPETVTAPALWELMYFGKTRG
jgi:hypothetical protein